MPSKEDKVCYIWFRAPIGIYSRKHRAQGINSEEKTQQKKNTQQISTKAQSALSWTELT